MLGAGIVNGRSAHDRGYCFIPLIIIIASLINLSKCAALMYSYQSKGQIMGRRIEVSRFVITRDTSGVHTLSVF